MPAGWLQNGEVIDCLRTPLWVFDVDHARIVWANAAAIKIWCADNLEALRARDMSSDMSPAVAVRLRQYKDDFEQQQASFEETWTIYPKGEPRSFRVVFSGVRLDDGRMAMLCEGAAEFTGTPQTLRSAEALLHTSMMITLYSMEGEVLYRNPAARAAACVGSDNLERRFVHGKDFNTLRDIWENASEGQLVAQIYCSNGIFWHELTMRKCRDAATGNLAWLVSEMDVTELKQTEQKADFLASYDFLTHLSNRDLLQTQAGTIISAAERDGATLAVLFIDLDRFKSINDSLGRKAGDDLLREIARRLQNALRSGDLIGRFSGDEFVAVLPNVDAQQATAICESLRIALRQSVLIGGMRLNPSVSIGISLFPQDGRDIDTLLRHADMAMYEAKSAGRNRICFYSADMNRPAQERLALEVALHEALANNRLSLHYQPQFRLSDGSLYGLEALMRWRHSHFGDVPPDRFIPLAEDSGLIDELGQWALNEACGQLSSWRGSGFAIPHVSVNLSPTHFHNPALPEAIMKALGKHGLQADDLTIEVTESVFMDEHPVTVATIAAIHNYGVRLSMDDFGTGYSSLGYLRRLPISEIKLDKSFISELQDGGTDSVLTSAVIRIGKSLNLTILAEGVENFAQMAFLSAEGCDAAQGYLIANPMPASSVSVWLQEHGGISRSARFRGPGAE